MTEGKQRSPRVGTTYRPRLKGQERQEVALSLAQAYTSGASIRDLAEARGMSYGTVRKLLLEADVTLRRRGERVRR